MANVLRPLSTGELLDRTFSLYRNNFPLFSGIAALVGFSAIAAPLVLLLMGITPPRPGQQMMFPRAFMIWSFSYFLAFVLFYSIGWALGSSATIFAVSKVHLEQPVTIGESYGKMLTQLGRILGLEASILLRAIGLLLLFGIIGGTLAVLVAGASRSGQRGSANEILAALIVFGFITVGYVFVIRLYCMYSLAFPVCVLENTPIGGSLRRSVFLTRKALGRIFLIFLLVALIGAAISICLQLPVDILALQKHALPAARVWGYAAMFLAYSLVFPIGAIAIALLYYDQRVRKEAFDLQLLMQSLDQPEILSTPAPIG